MACGGAPTRWFSGAGKLPSVASVGDGSGSVQMSFCPNAGVITPLSAGAIRVVSLGVNMSSSSGMLRVVLSTVRRNLLFRSVELPAAVNHDLILAVRKTLDNSSG